MSEKNPRRIILYLVAVAAFAGIGGTLLHFSGKAKLEKLATALSEANKCLVEGYHEDDKRMALAMRYREVDLVGEWPMLCEESLAALELAAIDQKSDEGQALADVVVELKDIAKEPFIDEARSLVLRKITTKLRAVWEAAAAPHLAGDGKDLAVLRVDVTDQRGRGVRYELLQYHDDATGFTAMEQTTGYPTAVVAQAMVRGGLEPGAYTPDGAGFGDEHLRDLRGRGLQIQRKPLP